MNILIVNMRASSKGEEGLAISIFKQYFLILVLVLLIDTAAVENDSIKYVIEH